PDGQSLTWEYDATSRPTAVSGIVSGASYDERGLLSGYELANGVSAAFAYDVLRREESLAFTGRSGIVLGLEVSRDRRGGIGEQRDTSAAGPRNAARYRYDGWHRLVEAVLAPGAANEETVTVGYDLLDRITSRTSSLGAASPSHVGSYTYGAAQHAAATE